MAARDTGVLASFENGVALELDAGRCECETADPFGSPDQINVFVDRQETYPSQFFAEVASTYVQENYVAFLVFTRADGDSPWMLSLAGGFTSDAASLNPPAQDGEGYLLAQRESPITSPDTVHSALAEYWRAAKRTGEVPSSEPFASGRWTTDFASLLTEHPQGAVAANGLIGYYAYQTDPQADGVFAFPEGLGWQIVCSAVRVQKTFTGRGAGDGPYQDAQRVNWGSSVAPGVYRALIVTNIAVPCIEIPSVGSGELARVLGAEEFPSVTETR